MDALRFPGNPPLKDIDQLTLKLRNLKISAVSPTDGAYELWKSGRHVDG
jgi:hypothetical protein